MLWLESGDLFGFRWVGFNINVSLQLFVGWFNNLGWWFKIRSKLRFISVAPRPPQVQFGINLGESRVKIR